MRAFINLFISIGLPVSALFVAAAIVYYSLNYDLDEAIKLGVLTGFFLGIGFSTVMTGLLLVMRKLHTSDSQETKAEVASVQELTNEPVNQKLILLMDRELAFDVAIHSIIDQHIGKVNKGNKRKGTISIRTPEQMIEIAVSSLTKHTSQIEVKADAHNIGVEKIIHYIKLKENSFLQY